MIGVLSFLGGSVTMTNICDRCAMPECPYRGLASAIIPCPMRVWQGLQSVRESWEARGVGGPPQGSAVLVSDGQLGRACPVCGGALGSDVRRRTCSARCRQASSRLRRVAS